jgi:hypothetical protein
MRLPSIMVLDSAPIGNQRAGKINVTGDYRDKEFFYPHY